MVHYCFKFQKICLSLSRSKRRANIPILRKSALCILNLCVCVITAPKRHLIKIRTFLKKIDSYLEKYEFARRFEGLKTWPNFLKFCTAIKNLANFWTANLKLLLSIQILCASYFKFVWKYPPPGFKTLEFQNFFFHTISSTQTIYCNKKLHTLSRFATLRAISNLFIFFIHPV